MDKYYKEILARTTKLGNLGVGERFYLEGTPYKVVGKCYSKKFGQWMTKILIDDRRDPDLKISGTLFNNVIVTRAIV